MKFSKTVGSTSFKLEQLDTDAPINVFSCSVEEYDEYLQKDAMRSQSDHVALTWLLRERSTGKIAAYMSLIADAIKLSVSEKELHDLNYPFKTIPAMKIAKLAVSKEFNNKYKGIGSFMIDSARTIARKCNDHYCACRFLTVDADIEHNEGVRVFYEKNGFIPN
ncbi:MAG: GNAT family N-acetyltransferase, partial [Bacteroidales bacterium]|nr:GNAT family N-acetyltransferase [Bacteroidales bacterium]